MEYGINSAYREIDRQYVAIDSLNKQLKATNDSVAFCKKTPTNCAQESQLTLVSAGIGDNQSELSHIRNDVALIVRDLAKIDPSLPKSQGYDDQIKAINDRLAATNQRIITSAKLISQLTTVKS